MSFISKYTKSVNDSYCYKTKKIGDYLYQIGFVEVLEESSSLLLEQAIITKINTKGEVIWEKTYEIEGKSTYFIDLVECDNGDILLTGGIDDKNDYENGILVLCRISSSGTIIWGKNLSLGSSESSRIFDKNVRAVLSKIDFETYILIQNYNFYDNPYYDLESDYFNYIIKINGDGSIIQQKKINNTDGFYKIVEVSTGFNQIVLHGYFWYMTPDDYQLNKYFILKLDFNLNYIQCLFLNENGNIYNAIEVVRVQIINDFLLVYGYTQQNYFITKIPNTTSSGTIPILKFSSAYYDCFFNNNFIYLQKESYVGETTVNTDVTKLDYNFSIIWTKKLDYSGISLSTLTDSRICLSNQRDTIGYLNLELDSCITSVIENPNTSQDSVTITTNTVSLSNSIIVTNDFTYNINLVSSSIDYICPYINEEIEFECIDKASFINRYSKPDLFNYLHAKEFIENDNSYIYAVGKTTALGLVSKIDSKGDLVWEKKFQVGDTFPLSFKKIIQLQKSISGDGSYSNKKDYKYILHGEVNDLHYLFCIDADGEILWTKQIEWFDKEFKVNILSTITDNSFYLAICDKNQKDTTNQPFIGEFDTYGELINGKQIVLSGTDFIINDLTIHAEGLVLSGRSPYGLNYDSKGFIVGLDLSLNLIHSATTNDENVTFHNVDVIGDQRYLVTGYSNQHNSVFVSIVSEGENNPLYLFPNSSNHGSVLQQNNEGFYVLLSTETNGVLYKFDWDFNVYWTKEISLDNGNNGIRNFEFNFETERVVMTPFNQIRGSLVAYLNKNIDSCLTTVLSNPEFSSVSCVVTSMEVQISNYQINLLEATASGTLLESQKTEICPTSIDVPCEDHEEVFGVKGNVSIQSPHLYLQSAGSQGFDSTRGNHLRWALKGALEKHLPKGDYAVPNVNFNKNNDYIKIYKATYEERKTILYFNQTPSLVFDAKKSWVYSIDNYLFTVNFKNAEKYDTVRLTVDPNSDPFNFVKHYGSELIEIESRTELSLAITPHFDVVDANGLVKLELLSVEDNKASSPKYVSYRKTLNQASVNDKKIFSENIKGIRFQSDLGTPIKIDFEFYSLQIKINKEEGKWKLLGNYALTKDSTVAFDRLEPQTGTVHGKWLRYNDNAYVNIDNYKEKWNGSSLDADEQIIKTVEQYINLSNDVSNPLANETILFNGDNEPVDGYEPDTDYESNQEANFEISNLNLLQIGALDYHVARMLGLGVLDLKTNFYNQKYIYLAEYITYGDLQDGLGAREVQHLYCSLPTSLKDERLPLPIDLKEPVPGIFYGLDTEAPQLLTDDNGYSIDGRTRFLTLFHQELHEEIPNSSFFYTDYEFISSQQTEPVYAGIEHAIVENSENILWDKPELPFDSRFFNIDSTVPSDKRNETISILLPEPVNSLFVHRQKQQGNHHYSSYGINWFSRAVNSSVRWNSETIFPVVNLLLPPTNINALLIRKESPLLLTSASEQLKLNAISDTDKTLIRLTFDYNQVQELKDYHKEINGELVNGYIEVDNSEEQFAETIGIFFRNEVPYTISGKIFSVEDDFSNEILAIVKTDVYTLISSGSVNNQLIPQIPYNNYNDFIGSVLLIDDKEFIIHDAYYGANGYPEFKVFKRDANGTLNTFETNTPIEELESPTAGGIFVVVENMQSVGAWGALGNPAPITFEVQIDSQVAAIHQEEILIVSPDALTVEKYIQKFRGIYYNATISKVIETVEEYEDENDTNPTITQRHLGVYKIEFKGLNNEVFSLNQHIQNSDSGNSVEWMNGVVRLHTHESVNYARREFKVLRTQNIGTDQNLTVYVLDPNFDEDNPDYNRNDAIVEGAQMVNYYPGYKVYLYKDEYSRLTESFILPNEGEGDCYSIFGLRSQLASHSLFSKISVPCLMFAQEISEPRKPEKPLGGLYATRPDFYGKSTYSFTTKFEKKPYSVQFNRTSDIQILTALYNSTPVKDEDGSIVAPSTVDFTLNDIFKNGQDEYYVNRWENLLGFDYDYPVEDIINTSGLFKKYPDSAEGVILPLPDNPKFISSINNFITEHNNFYNNLPEPVDTITQIDNLYQVIIPEVIGRNEELKVVDFVKQVIYNSFVPLTEVPVIFKYIKTEDEGYAPLPKKQVIRDRNGNLLSPEDPNFDMAPMMVIKTPNDPAVTEHKIQFTDFGLDGSSNAKYFYAVREFDLQMKAGEYSAITGPINLVNSAPPSAPEIVKVIPVLENRVLDVKPEIQFEINSYSSVQNIKKVAIYRAFNSVDSLSVRTMKEVRVIDLEVEGLLESDKWVFKDDFSDLGFVPYGDPLFYRIVVSRVIEYSERDGSIVIDYAPSEASKLVITNITENYSPESPILRYASEPILPNGELHYVALYCNKTAYKGKYHLYKMNSQGNWIEIKVTTSNSEFIYFPLEDTSLGSNILFTKNDDGETIYHHFKVIAENTAGMFSNKENILTVHNQDVWEDVGGIGSMAIEGTLIVRPNN